MKKAVGLWIDHRKAVIVSVADLPDAPQVLKSGMDKHVRFSAGDGSEDGSAEDQRDRRFTGQLSRYYDQVIKSIGDAEFILIVGPGEAKVELYERLVRKTLGSRIVAVETVDKLTDRQITALVRKRFARMRAPGRPVSVSVGNGKRSAAKESAANP